MNKTLKTKNHKNCLVIPNSVWAIKPLIEAYLKAEDRQKTVWHIRCIDSCAYEKWRASQLFKKGVFDLAFSGLSAKVYSDFFALSTSGLPNCTASRVKSASSLAIQLNQELPAISLLPIEAQSSSFQAGLNSLCHWRPSQLQYGTTLRGNPEQRWLIRALTEEFCFAIAIAPSVAVIGDLMRLGWPNLTNRSIRNTLNHELLSDAMQKANQRRYDENKAIAVTHQALTKATVRSKLITPLKEEITINGDTAIIDEIERLASKFTDDYLKERMLSHLRSLRDEMSYPQIDEAGGN